MRYWLAILLMMTGFAVSAQNLRGSITDSESGEPLFSVTVVNTATQESTYSDENGEYRISAKSGHNISFSLLGYRNIIRSMPPTLGNANLDIKMELISYKLGEITITPGYTPYQLDSARRRSTYQRSLARTKTKSVMSPVSLLAEKLSGRSKQLYNFQKNFQKWEGDRFVDSRYSPELVTQLTGLTGDSLGKFMVAYPMPYDYARGASELELQMWIRFNYKQWMRLPLLNNTADTTTNKK